MASIWRWRVVFSLSVSADDKSTIQFQQQRPGAASRTDGSICHASLPHVLLKDSSTAEPLCSGEVMLSSPSTLLRARPVELTFTRLHLRSLSLRPGNLLTLLYGALSMGFKRQRFPHLLPSKLHGFGFLPWRDLHPQVCATLRWARQFSSLTPDSPRQPLEGPNEHSGT